MENYEGSESLECSYLGSVVKHNFYGSKWVNLKNKARASTIADKVFECEFGDGLDPYL